MPVLQANTSSSSSTSLPTVLNTPQSDWGLQLSQMLSALGQYQYSWALGQFAHTSAVSDAQIQNFLQGAGYGMGMAKNLLGRYQDTFEPMMDQYIKEAGSYASAARQNFNAGAAESTAEQAYDQARRGAEQELQSYGIDPSSGRYQDLVTANRTAAAAAAAGAGTQASINTAAVGRQMRQNAVQMGQQLPGMTVNALNSAYQGISGAENANLGTANAGATLTSTVPPFMNASASANKLPPVGQNQQSKSGSVSGGGGGGGGKVKDDQAGSNGGQGGRLASPPGGQYRGVPGLQYQGNSAGPGRANTQGLPKENDDNNQDEGGGMLPSWFDPTTGQLDPSATGSWDGNWGQPPSTNVSDNPQLSAPDPQNFGKDFQSPLNQDQNADPWANAPGGSANDSQLSSFSQPDPGQGFGGQNDYQPFGQNMQEQWDPNTYAPDQQSQADSGNYDSGNSGNYNSQGNQGGDNYGDYSGGGGYYARGGPVRKPHGMIPMGRRPQQQGPRRAMTTGGSVPSSASPSRGRQTDDVNARLNAGEFVIPKDVTADLGQSYFQKLIKKSRMSRTGMAGPPAQPQMKPAQPGPARFQSQQV